MLVESDGAAPDTIIASIALVIPVTSLASTAARSCNWAMIYLSSPVLALACAAATSAGMVAVLLALTAACSAMMSLRAALEILYFRSGTAGVAVAGAGLGVITGAGAGVLYWARAGDAIARPAVESTRASAVDVVVITFS